MATARRLHEALSGRRLTRLEYEHALPRLQDALLDAQFTLGRSRGHAVVMIVISVSNLMTSPVWFDDMLR